MMATSRRRTLVAFAVLCVFSIIQSVRLSPCPDQCTCTDALLRCEDLKEFPNLGNRIAKVIEFIACTFPRIPEGSFENVRGIEKLVIKHSTINLVEAGAFRGLRNLEDLLVVGPEADDMAQVSSNENSQEWTVINQVQRDAFSDIADVDHVYFYYVNFGLIQTNAFTNVHDIDHFNITFCKVQTLETRAFAGLDRISELSISHVQVANPDSFAFDHIWNVTSFTMEHVTSVILRKHMFSGYTARLNVHDNHFQTMECEVFGNRAPAHIEWTNNYIRCDCRLEWLFLEEEPVFPPDLLEGFRCEGPDIVDDEKLSALIEQSILPCDGYEPRASCLDPLGTYNPPSSNSSSRKLWLIILLPILLVIIIGMGVYIWKKKYFKSPISIKSKKYNLKSRKSLTSVGGGLADQQSIRNNLVKSQRSFIFAGDSEDDDDKKTEKTEFQTRIYQPRRTRHIPSNVTIPDSATGDEGFDEKNTYSVYEELTLPEDMIPAPVPTPPRAKRDHYDVPPPPRYGPPPRRVHYSDRGTRPSTATSSGQVTDEDDYLLPMERRAISTSSGEPATDRSISQISEAPSRISGDHVKRSSLTY